MPGYVEFDLIIGGVIAIHKELDHFGLNKASNVHSDYSMTT